VIRPVYSDSARFGLAAELYQCHTPDQEGRCRMCQLLSCPVRIHAILVIQAAGVDPAVLDSSQRSVMTEPTAEFPKLQRRTPGAALEEELRGHASPVEWWGGRSTGP
jgi:hypothetical protein